MPKPNIVIIVLDTLREDHAQGLDKLLDYGFVKYQNAIAPAPGHYPHTPPCSPAYTPQNTEYTKQKNYGPANGDC
jgi:hypothetical protein